jgi:cell division septation protein DedD
VTIAESESLSPVQTAQVQPEPAWWPTPAVRVELASAPVTAEIPAAQPASADELEVRFAASAETLVRPDRAIIRTAAVSRPIAPVFRPEVQAPVRSTAKGRFVVQLGAFSNEANAERAWQQAERSYGLGQYQPTTATINLNGRSLHRVSVSGFATSVDAGRLCNSIKSHGGACFVRTNAGDSAIRWAARYSPTRNRRV